MKLSLQLKNVRLTAGLTQKQLSEVSGVRQATISDIESGRRDPTIATLQVLADVLKCEFVLTTVTR